MKNIDYTFFYTQDPKTKEYKTAEGLDYCKIKTYQKGDYINYKGDPANELSIVVEGEVTIEFVLESGFVIRSVKHNAPTIIGAIAILTHEGRYLTDTIANTDVVTISFTRVQIENRMRTSIDFMYNLISFISTRVEFLSSHIAILTQKNIKAKLAFYILLCSDGRKYKFDKSIAKLASYIAVERPSLSREIAKMVDEGIITYQKGRGEIIDDRRLKELIE